MCGSLGLLAVSRANLGYLCCWCRRGLGKFSSGAIGGLRLLVGLFGGSFLGGLGFLPSGLFFTFGLSLIL